MNRMNRDRFDLTQAMSSSRRGGGGGQQQQPNSRGEQGAQQQQQQDIGGQGQHAGQQRSLQRPNVHPAVMAARNLVNMASPGGPTSQAGPGAVGEGVVRQEQQRLQQLQRQIQQSLQQQGGGGLGQHPDLATAGGHPTFLSMMAAQHQPSATSTNPLSSLLLPPSATSAQSAAQYTSSLLSSLYPSAAGGGGADQWSQALRLRQVQEERRLALAQAKEAKQREEEWRIRLQLLRSGAGENRPLGLQNTPGARRESVGGLGERVPFESRLKSAPLLQPPKYEAFRNTKPGKSPSEGSDDEEEDATKKPAAGPALGEGKEDSVRQEGQRKRSEERQQQQQKTVPAQRAEQAKQREHVEHPSLSVRTSFPLPLLPSQAARQAEAMGNEPDTKRQRISLSSQVAPPEQPPYRTPRISSLDSFQIKWNALRVSISRSFPNADTKDLNSLLREEFGESVDNGRVRIRSDTSVTGMYSQILSSNRNARRLRMMRGPGGGSRGVDPSRVGPGRSGLPSSVGHGPMLGRGSRGEGRDAHALEDEKEGSSFASVAAPVRDRPRPSTRRTHFPPSA